MRPRASEGVSGTKPPVRIAVDMDEVIADYFGEQVARYESWSGTAVDISATEGKRLRECGRDFPLWINDSRLLRDR